MKNFSILLLILVVNTVHAQDFKKNEFGTFAGIYYNEDLAFKNVVSYGQEYTRWFTKNVGVGVGTFRSNQDLIPTNNTTEELAKTRQESNRYWNFDVKGRFNLQKFYFIASTGVTAVKTYESSYQINPATRPNDRLTLSGKSSTMVYPAWNIQPSLGYQITPNISGEIFAREYFGDKESSLYGLKVAYHFNVNKDSLGILPDGERSFGVTVGAGFCGDLQNSETGFRVVLPYAGIYFERQLSLAWKSRLELLYARRGASSRRLEAGNVTYLVSNFRGDYLQIPLLFENEFAYQWNLFFGPHVSVLLNGKKSVSGVEINADNRLTAALGVTAGISRNINDRLSAEGRYVLDFVNFSANPYATALNDFRLGLRYKIR